MTQRPIPRDVVQTLTTKLDLNAISVKAARKFVMDNYGYWITATSRNGFVKTLNLFMKKD